MKRSFAMALALALVFTLSACGEPAETEEQIAARELDSEIWSVVTAVSDQLQDLDDIVNSMKKDFDDDTVNLIIAGLKGDSEFVNDFSTDDNYYPLISAIDTIKAGQDTLAALRSDNESAAAYIESVKNYTDNARGIYEETLTYLLSNSSDAFANFFESYKNVSDLTDDAVEKRIAFLSDAGFSSSEISDFPAEIRDDTAGE